MENNETYMGMSRDEFMMHYGRKGMKWYQKIFSKPISALKKRKGDSDSDEGKSEKKSKKHSSKDVKDMSNEELKDAIKRLEDEAKLLKMQAERKSKTAKFVSSVAGDVVVPALKNAGKNAIQNSFQNLAETKIKEVMGLDKKSDLDILKNKNERMRAQKEYDELNDYFEKKKIGKSDYDNLKDENDRLRAERDHIILTTFLEEHKK